MADWDNRAWLARVRDGSGGWIAGTGFAVDATHVLTCAHVVLEAGADGPKRRVWVDFPMLEGAGCWALVMEDGWAPGDETKGDTALLHLEAPPPGLVPVPVRVAHSLRGQAFIAHGFPPHYDTGAEASGLAGGRVGLEWVQLQIETGLAVQPGFSGGPVWSEDLHAVVALLTNRDEGTQGRVAFAVPIGVVAGRSEVVAAALPTALELDSACDSHWVPRSRGAAGVDSGGRWLFQGRRRALSDLSGWLVSDEGPAMRVVTGSPGCGKSAVLGRIVTTADRRFRNRIPGLSEQDAGVPPAGVIGVTVHARDLFVTDVVAHIAGVLDIEGIQGPNELLTAAGGLRGVRVVVDAVDEAKQPVELARFLTDLSRLGVRILVGTREHLLSKLDDPDPMWLDREPFMDRTDVGSYVAALLAGDGQAADGARSWPGDASVEEVAAEITEAADGNFLVAQLVAQSIQLSGSATRPFPGRVHEAFDRLLDALPDAQRVRDLLLPLAYALGNGLPAGELWLSGCAGLRRPYQLADLQDLLASAAVSFLTTATSDGHTRQYRLFHQALNEALTRDRNPDEDARRLWSAWQPAEARGWSDASEYLVMHAAEHASTAGALVELLSVPEYVSIADFDHLLPLLATGSPAGDSPAGVAILRVSSIAGRLDPQRRRQLLALSALHLGFTDIHRRWVSEEAMFRPSWAHSLGSPHQELTPADQEMAAIAMGRVQGRNVVVTADANGSVRIWEVSSGRQLGAAIPAHDGWVSAGMIARVSGRDVIVTSGGEDETIRMWDPNDGRQVGPTLIASNNGVTALAYARRAERDFLFAGGYDGSVTMWAVGTDFEFAQTSLSPGRRDRGATVPVEALLVTRIGGHASLVVASHDGSVASWRHADDGRFNVPPITANNPIQSRWPASVALLGGRDRCWTVRGYQNGLLQMSDAATGEILWERDDEYFYGIERVATGRAAGRDVVVIADGNGELQVRDAETGDPLGEPRKAPTNKVYGLTVGPGDNDRNLIVSNDDSGRVRIWDVDPPSAGTQLIGHREPVLAIAVGKLAATEVVVSAGADSKMMFWDARNGKPVRKSISAHIFGINAVVFGRFRGERVLASAGADGEVQVRDAGTLKPVVDPTYAAWRGGGLVGVLQVAAVGDSIVSLDGARVWRWRWRKRRWVKDEVIDRGVFTVLRVVRFRGSDVIAAAGNGRSIRLFDAGDGRPKGRLRSPDPVRITTVAGGRLDGRDVIVGGREDGVVLLWRADERSAPSVALTGHTASIIDIAVGRFGGRTLIATCSDDCTVRVWDARTLHTEHVLDLLARPEAVAFAKSGKIVVAVGYGVCVFDP